MTAADKVAASWHVQGVGDCALHALAHFEPAFWSSLCRRSMIEGSTRISSGMAIKQLASRGSKGAGGGLQHALQHINSTLVCRSSAPCVHALRSDCSTG
jgi:hypothetical protein